MSENEKEPMHLSVQRIYAKDISFESPKTPGIFAKGWEPAFDVNLGVQHVLVEEDIYEVVLKVSVTLNDADKNVIFMIEVQQAGIFSIKSIEKAQLGHVLGAFCPSILFPYARETIDTLANRGSFPSLMLDPVNFEAMYNQTVEQQQKNAKPVN